MTVMFCMVYFNILKLLSKKVKKENPEGKQPGKTPEIKLQLVLIILLINIYAPPPHTHTKAVIHFEMTGSKLEILSKLGINLPVITKSVVWH